MGNSNAPQQNQRKTMDRSPLRVLGVFEGVMPSSDYGEAEAHCCDLDV